MSGANWTGAETVRLLQLIIDTPSYRATLFNKTNFSKSPKWIVARQLCFDIFGGNPYWREKYKAKKWIQKVDGVWKPTDLWNSAVSDPVRGILTRLKKTYEDAVQEGKIEPGWKAWSDIRDKGQRKLFKGLYPWFFLYRQLITEDYTVHEDDEDDNDDETKNVGNVPVGGGDHNTTRQPIQPAKAGSSPATTSKTDEEKDRRKKEKRQRRAKRALERLEREEREETERKERQEIMRKERDAREAEKRQQEIEEASEDERAQSEHDSDNEGGTEPKREMTDSPIRPLASTKQDDEKSERSDDSIVEIQPFPDKYQYLSQARLPSPIVVDSEEEEGQDQDESETEMHDGTNETPVEPLPSISVAKSMMPSRKGKERADSSTQPRRLPSSSPSQSVTESPRSQYTPSRPVSPFPLDELPPAKKARISLDTLNAIARSSVQLSGADCQSAKQHKRKRKSTTNPEVALIKPQPELEYEDDLGTDSESEDSMPIEEERSTDQPGFSHVMRLLARAPIGNPENAMRSIRIARTQVHEKRVDSFLSKLLSNPINRLSTEQGYRNLYKRLIIHCSAHLKLVARRIYRPGTLPANILVQAVLDIAVFHGATLCNNEDEFMRGPRQCTRFEFDDQLHGFRMFDTDRKHRVIVRTINPLYTLQYIDRVYSSQCDSHARKSLVADKRSAARLLTTYHLHWMNDHEWLLMGRCSRSFEIVLRVDLMRTRLFTEAYQHLLEKEPHRPLAGCRVLYQPNGAKILRGQDSSLVNRCRKLFRHAGVVICQTARELGDDTNAPRYIVDSIVRIDARGEEPDIDLARGPQPHVVTVLQLLRILDARYQAMVGGH